MKSISHEHVVDRAPRREFASALTVVAEEQPPCGDCGCRAMAHPTLPMGRPEGVPTCRECNRCGGYVADARFVTTIALDAADFEATLCAAVLGVANVYRRLRRQAPIATLSELHSAEVANLRAATIEAALVQHPAVVLEAANDAGDGLFELFNHAVTEPDAAIMNDDERLKEASRAWFRRAMTMFRESLAAQLAILRSPEQAQP